VKTSVNAAKAAKVRVENILSAECCATKVAVTKAAVTRVAVTKVVATKAVATRVVATRVAATRVVETRVVETTTRAYLHGDQPQFREAKPGRMSGLGHFIVEQSQNLKPTPTVTTF
jgi:hypothetical protein